MFRLCAACLVTVSLYNCTLVTFHPWVMRLKLKDYRRILIQWWPFYKHLFHWFKVNFLAAPAAFNQNRSSFCPRSGRLKKETRLDEPVIPRKGVADEGNVRNTQKASGTVFCATAFQRWTHQKKIWGRRLCFGSLDAKIRLLLGFRTGLRGSAVTCATDVFLFIPIKSLSPQTH